MMFCSGTSGSIVAIAGRSVAFVRISMRSPGTSGRSRSTASRSMGCPVTSGSSCFGRAGVLMGQNLDPTPPARMTVQSDMNVCVREAVSGETSPAPDRSQVS